MREKTCCFTGHRKIPAIKKKAVVQQLKTEIIALINQGYLYFGVGGALGFDTLAAEAIIELRKQYPHIKLILVLPCETQTKGWKEKDIEIYDEIKHRADKIVYTSREYTGGCMHKRNRHLVDNSSVCIAYLTERTGGTAYTVYYATKHGLTIRNIADLL